MIKLTCLVIGGLNTFTITDVDENQDVGTLTVVIQEAIQYSGAAQDLILFKAVKFDAAKGEIKENSDYMPAVGDEVKTLSQSKVYVNDETYMFPSRNISRYFDGKNLPNKDLIHILVKLPETETYNEVEEQISRASGHIAAKPKIILDYYPSESNGLSLYEKRLNRDKLVEDLLRILQHSRFAVISSPPATGKTSLIQLAYWKYGKELTFIDIKCIAGDDPFKVLGSRGVDFEKETSALGAQCIVVLDDAHNYYDNKRFWTHLVKHSVNWLPSRFIIAATHDLTMFNRSPVELHSLPHIAKEHILVDDNEGFQLIDLIGTIIQSDIVRIAILRECCGVIGAIKLSVLLMNQKFMQFGNSSESEMLQFLFSDEFTGKFSRVFSSTLGEIDDVFRNFLKIMFVSEFSTLPQLDQKSMDILLDLEEGGAVVEIGSGNYGFSSPLAERYYFKKVFPNRSRIFPNDIITLIQNAITNMSSTNLKKSTIDSKDFPKEAVFQHEFMTGLTMALHPSCFVCPELSRVFPEKGDNREMVQNAKRMKNDGEIDFYIDGTLRWGIELVVNGDKISEHASRFSKTGKYYPLGVTDYAIVDFRRSAEGRPTNITAIDKRISVFFPFGEFDKCICRLGNRNDVELNLSS